MVKLGKYMAVNTCRNISEATSKTVSQNCKKITQASDTFIKTQSKNPIKNVFSAIKKLV